MSAKLFDVVFDDEVVSAPGAYGFDRRLGGVQEKNPLLLGLNLGLDHDVPDLEIGAVVDANVATECLAQVNRPKTRSNQHKIPRIKDRFDSDQKNQENSRDGELKRQTRRLGGGRGGRRGRWSRRSLGGGSGSGS